MWIVKKMYGSICIVETIRRQLFYTKDIIELNDSKYKNTQFVISVVLWNYSNVPDSHIVSHYYATKSCVSYRCSRSSYRFLNGWAWRIAASIRSSTASSATSFVPESNTCSPVACAANDSHRWRRHQTMATNGDGGRRVTRSATRWRSALAVSTTATPLHAAATCVTSPPSDA